MKRILINATHNEEVRVALCKGNHLYDFDLENRTREQKKANIYKGHVTRVEPSLEAVFVEYGSKRQGFLPVREIASEYLSGNPREENIRKLIKEGDELIVQVEKEERGNKGAALSTYVSLAGRYLVLMPNNPKGGGISRQISGKLREDMKRMLGNLDLPKGMSVIVRTAGIGKTQEDLQHDLNHLLNIWNAIQDQNKKYASPRLVHQEAGVVTRAVRDYLRDDISEIWIDNEEAFIEAETFVKAVMPTQVDKLRKYTDFEPMFTSFNVERQIETAYQREVRLPSGGSIVIDQTEALVSIDINSAKSTKGADVAETAYNTNLEAADEIARQLRLRDMGGLIVIDFIDMNDNKHQKDVEKRLVDATKYDRARVQFGEISRFGLMEMSRQRLRPSLEESTGYICPRCHGNGMIRDLRSLSLSIMRQIEQTALKERHGEVQAEVPTDIAAFLLNEKRESLVYLEQDSGTRITILPHAHLESPNFNIHFNHHGFAPASYERVTDTQQQETSGLGYDVDWQTAESERPEQQPVRQPRQKDNTGNKSQSHTPARKDNKPENSTGAIANPQLPPTQESPATQAVAEVAKPAAVAWLSNLFAPTPQAQMSATVSSADAAQAIESIVNTGAESRGAFGNVNASALASAEASTQATTAKSNTNDDSSDNDSSDNDSNDKDRRRSRRNNRNKNDKRHNDRNKSDNRRRYQDKGNDNKSTDNEQKHEQKNDQRSDNRSEHRSDNRSNNRTDNRSNKNNDNNKDSSSQKELPKREPNSKRESRGSIERGETKQPQKSDNRSQNSRHDNKSTSHKSQRSQNDRNVDPNEVNLHVTEAENTLKEVEVVHISLDDSKPKKEHNTKDTGSSDAKPEQPVTHSEQKSDAKSPKQADDKQEPSASNVKAAAETAKPETKPETKVEASVSDKADSTPKPTDKKSETTDTSSDAVETSQSNQSSDSTSKADDKSVESASIATTTDEDDKDQTPDRTLSFDTESLFADRYVVAQKFGQAPNDPRVIKASLQQQLIDDAPAAETKTAAASITGSVGQFIHTHLAQPSMRLAKDGVITCFLAALNAHKETSGGSSKRTPKSRTAKPRATKPKSLQSFSFVNYGYQSLSPSYLERFAKMTSATAAYSVEQGKTETKPTAIGARASNDPRGQHPDFTPAEQTVTSDTAASDASEQPSEQTPKQPSEQEASAQSSAPQQSPAQAMSELLKQNVGNFVSRVLGGEGETLLNEGKTETAFLQALNQPWDVFLKAAQAIEVTTDNSAVDVASSHREYSQQTTAELANSEQAAEDEAQYEHQEAQNAENAANKTSIETYKSMIENISEQLLPQTGLLNLTSPKVPKARSRKVKEDVKKPTDSDDNSQDS